MALTANKNYNNQVTGSNVNTWGVVLNSNFSVIDLNLAGRLALSVAGSANVTVTANQAQNLTHVLTGVLTGNIQYIMPVLGGFYFIQNSTTGAFTLTVTVSGGAGGVVVPQGQSYLIFVNPDSLTLLWEPLGSILYVGGVSAGSANAQTVASVSPNNYALTAGNIVSFVAGFSVSAASTLAVGATAATAMKKMTASGLVDTATGDVVTNGAYLSYYNGTVHIILNPTLGTAAFQPVATFLQAANNLSDVANAGTSRTNLGVPPATRALNVSGLVTGGGDLSADRTFTVTASSKAQMQAATDTTTAVDPAQMQNHPGVAKASCLLTWNGSTYVISESYNVSGIVVNGTGDVTISFTTPFANAFFRVGSIGCINTANSVYCGLYEHSSYTRNSNNYRVQVVNLTNAVDVCKQINLTFDGTQ